MADPSARFRLLMVEDDNADAMLIEEALCSRAEQLDITRAEDGVAALEYLSDPRHPRPDMIILDLNMPRMNGRELLKILKRDPRLMTIPTIVLSTSEALADVDGAYRDHANAYVSKPVGLDDFVRAVRSLDEFFLQTALLATHAAEDSQSAGPGTGDASSDEAAAA